MRYEEAIRVASNESKFEMLINGNLNIEHAAIVYKNFSGDPTRVNPAGGKRTFALVLNEEYAEKLASQGWNVKVRELKNAPSDDDRALTVSWEQYNLQYRQSFDNALIYTEIVVNENATYPPKIYKVSELAGQKSMIQIPPAQYYRLDSEELYNIDLVIHPYQHGRSIANPDAKKGYLNSMYAMSAPIDDFGGKYAGVPVIVGEA